MIKNIIFIIYVIIIGIALGTLIISMNYNDQGIIEFGNTALIEVDSNVLEPKIVKGDLVIINTKNKNVKEKDIISYITLENKTPIIQTNAIAAITEDANKEKIYSLKKEDGTIENIDDSCILGIYTATIPYAGTILTYILSKKGFLTITLVPASILFLLFLGNFILGLSTKNKE